MHKALKMLFLAQVIMAFMVFAYTISTSHAAEELIPENPEDTGAINDMMMMNYSRKTLKKPQQQIMMTQSRKML
ncbi:MAG: hypothetical protein NG784_12555 [Candidatus Jettenia sp.]|nr:hypothetical protein [Candidatus Jettenia sp.]